MAYKLENFLVQVSGTDRLLKIKESFSKYNLANLAIFLLSFAILLIFFFFDILKIIIFLYFCRLLQRLYLYIKLDNHANLINFKNKVILL